MQTIDNSGNCEINLDCQQQHKIFMKEGFSNIKKITISTNGYHEQMTTYGNIDIYSSNQEKFLFKSLLELVLTGTYDIINDFFNCFCWIANSVDDINSQIQNAYYLHRRLAFNLMCKFKIIRIKQTSLSNFMKIFDNNQKFRNHDQQNGQLTNLQPHNFQQDVQIWLEDCEFELNQLLLLDQKFKDKINFKITKPQYFLMLSDSLQKHQFKFNECIVNGELLTTDIVKVLQQSFAFISLNNFIYKSIVDNTVQFWADEVEYFNNFIFQIEQYDQFLVVIHNCQAVYFNEAQCQKLLKLKQLKLYFNNHCIFSYDMKVIVQQQVLIDSQIQFDNLVNQVNRCLVNKSLNIKLTNIEDYIIKQEQLDDITKLFNIQIFYQQYKIYDNQQKLNIDMQLLNQKYFDYFCNNYLQFITYNVNNRLTIKNVQISIQKLKLLSQKFKLCLENQDILVSQMCDQETLQYFITNHEQLCQSIQNINIVKIVKNCQNILFQLQTKNQIEQLSQKVDTLDDKLTQYQKVYQKVLFQLLKPTSSEKQ